MKFGVLQCDVCNGDLPGNIGKILTLAQQATERGAEFLLASAGALAGPQAQGWSCLADFAPACHAACQELATRLTTPLLLALDQPLLLRDGLAMTLTGASLRVGEHNIRLLGYGGAGEGSPSLVVDLHPRPFYPGWQDEYRQALARHGCPAIGVNLVGGYGSFVYQGSSIQVDASGELLARGRAFTEDALVLEWAEPGQISPAPEGVAAQWAALTLGIRDFVRKSGACRCVLGLSGGIDSALVACLACEAIGPENVLALLLPSPYTSQASLEDATQLAENLRMPAKVIPIQEPMQTFASLLEPVFATLPSRSDLVFENLQARIRGVILMAVANRLDALVLNTGNQSEAAMGYSTLYGDTVGALAVLGDLLKTRVYELARWRNQESEIIPPRIIEREPSAELRDNQKDSDSLPPYPVLDAALQAMMETGAIPDRDLGQRVMRNVFKRMQLPPALLVGRYHLPVTPLDGAWLPPESMAT